LAYLSRIWEHLREWDNLNFSLDHRVQNDSGAHPTSYPMVTRGSYLRGRVAGAWTSI